MEIKGNVPLCILSGEAIHGKGIEKTPGMPTDKLHIQREKLPCFGVCASIVHVRGAIYLSATHVGVYSKLR